VSVDGDHRLPWLASVPGTRVIQAGVDRSSVELDAGVEPDAVLAAAMAAGARIRHFELADPTLEQVFIAVVGRPANEEIHLAPAGAADGGPGQAGAPGSASSGGAGSAAAGSATTARTAGDAA
jgi:hypothetical protein